MPDDLYQRDLYEWSGQQAALLRRVAAGERLNEVDWPHIIEEIEDVGGSALRAVRSLLRRALEHLLKLHGWPHSDAAEHWRRETRAFLADARDAYTPSMWQRVDLAALYQQSRRAVSVDTMHGQPPGELPAQCPFTLDALLSADVEIDMLLQKLREAATAPHKA